MSDDDRRPPSPAPIDWRRSAAPVFRAGPLPGGESLDPIPQPPRPAPARPAASRPVNLFRDSLVPQAPRPAVPTLPSAAPDPGPSKRPDLTVRPLPPTPRVGSPAPTASPARVQPQTAAAPLPPRPPEDSPVVVPAFARSTPRRGPSRPVMIGGAVAAVMAAGLAIWLLVPRTAQAPAAPPAVDASAPLPVPSTEAPVTAVPVQPVEAFESVTDQAPAAVATPPAAAREAAPAPAPAAARPVTSEPEPSVEEATAPPPAPVIDTAPLVQPTTQAPAEPPAAEPAPRTDGETILTRPR